MMINLLEDHDQELLDIKSHEHFCEINTSLDKIENLIGTFHPSEEKISDFKLKQNKDKIIMKNLFPLYWIMQENTN